MQFADIVKYEIGFLEIVHKFDRECSCVCIDLPLATNTPPLACRLFTESLHCTQKLDLHAVAKEVPAGVRMLLRWLETTRMVHHIAISDHASAMAEHDEQLAKLEGHGEGGHAKHGKGGHGKGKHGKGHGEHDEHGHKRH